MLGLSQNRKLLIAIVACHHRSWATDTVRQTWVADINGRCDYKFFYGNGSHGELKADEVILDCEDAYRGLACKVQAICKWAVEHGYDYLVKVDDDTYCRAERVIRAVDNWKQFDYVGRRNGFTDQYHECIYARGGTGYFLSRKAMEYLASRPLPNPDIPKDYAEDSWVGYNLQAAGIECIEDSRLRCADFSGPGRGPRPMGYTGWKKDIPQLHNEYITSCEFLGHEMEEVHKEWLKSCEKHTALFNRLKVK